MGILDFSTLTKSELDGVLRRDLENLVNSYGDQADILAELIQNAVDAIGATGRGNGELTVIIGRRGGSDPHYVYVQDDGIGMDAALVDKVFNPGFSLNKKLGKTLGNKGAGLSYVVPAGLRAPVRPAGPRRSVRSAFARPRPRPPAPVTSRSWPAGSARARGRGPAPPRPVPDSPTPRPPRVRAMREAVLSRPAPAGPRPPGRRAGRRPPAPIAAASPWRRRDAPATCLLRGARYAVVGRGRRAPALRGCGSRAPVRPHRPDQQIMVIMNGRSSCAPVVGTWV